MTVERYTSGDKRKRMAQTGLLAGLIVVLAVGAGCEGPVGTSVSASRPLPAHLAPRAMPTGPDENFERVKKILAGVHPGAGEVGRWNEGEEDRFARLIAEAESLRPNAPQTLQLRQQFQQLLAVWRERKIRRLPPVALPETYVDSIGITMKLIRPGKFVMGSPEGEGGLDDERPQREVTISPGAPGFYMAIHEITQAQWRALMGTAPWHGNPLVQESPDIAATNISWDAATEFCEKLSAKTGLTVRLPTEAEWEYTCRAGSTTKYSFGDDESKLGDYAWYDGNAYSVGRNYPHPVGRKRPNAWGLYDMHGNAWEWCADWYDSKYYSAGANKVDPFRGARHARDHSDHPLRGGSWWMSPKYCRSAFRSYLTFGARRAGGFGFRVVSPAAVGHGVPG